MRYKNGMIKKLMESFESNAAKLANLSTSDVDTLTIKVKDPDVDGRLVGINHWTADTEESDGVKMTFSGHPEALARHYKTTLMISITRTTADYQEGQDSANQQET
jgi:hypothetical protein